MVGFTVGGQLGASVYDISGYASPHYTTSVCTLLATITAYFVIPDYYHKPNTACIVIKREESEKFEDEVAAPEEHVPIRSSLDDIRIVSGPSGKKEVADVAKSNLSVAGKLPAQTSKVPLNITGIIIASIPALSTLSLSINRGYFVLFVTPYVIKTFGISITQAGTYLTVYNCFSVVWFILCGYISQRQLIRHSYQAILGTTIAIFGLFLSFPSPHHTPVLCHTYIVYLGVFLFAMGDTLNFSVATAVMEQTYQFYNKFVLPDRVKLLIGSIAITFWNFGTYFGRFLGGLFIEFVVYEVGAWIFDGITGISLVALVGVVMSIYAKIRLNSRLSVQD